MLIQQDGAVIVPLEDEGTFRDQRLPLLVRLDKLAVLIGDGASGLPIYGYEAEKLVREATVRLQGFMNTANQRQETLSSLTQQVRTWATENERLRAENEQLARERDEALWRVAENG